MASDLLYSSDPGRPGKHERVATRQQNECRQESGASAPGISQPGILQLLPPAWREIHVTLRRVARAEADTL
jgi:hypothetical protein